MVLIRGDEELLVDRAIRAAVDTARAVHGEVEVHTLSMPEQVDTQLMDLLSPSLFGDPVAVVVRQAQDLEAPVWQRLQAYATAPEPGVLLVVEHDGKVKARKQADALAATDGVVERLCPRVTKAGDRLAFVRAEFDRLGRPPARDAVELLVQTVGNDLRELAAAVQQLVVDTTGTVDAQLVATYYTGRAEVSGFAIADKAVEGDTAGALDLLRWGLSNGLAGPLVTSALADSLRTLGLVGGHRRGNAFTLAKQLGMPAWKIEKAQRQLLGWHPDGLAVAVRAVARADAAVKGEERAVSYALERAVLAVATASRA